MNTRIEKDSLGEVEIPNHVYWGSQTQRSLHFFNMGDEIMPVEIIRALVRIKKVSAKVNAELGLLKKDYAHIIMEVCDDILLHGKFMDQFPLRVWQTGSGTQSNMNVNEVISNIANERLGSPLGSKSPIHPNDHVNFGQSSNDGFPTALHIAVATMITERLLPSLHTLEQSFEEKVETFQSILKIGRTHLQDATPMTVGQEFSAFATQIKLNIKRIKESLHSIYPLAQGGTAVGTGLNTHKEFAEKFAREMMVLTGIPFTSAHNKFEALATHDGLVYVSGALNTLAVSLMKIGNDMRLLGSGPRAGLNELKLPENEPGSSIMPGKVNPTQAEALTMIAAQVMGNHTTVTIAGSMGHLQLNVFKPVIGYNILQSVRLLSDACESFRLHCLKGIELNEAQLTHNCAHTLMLATALNAVIGYDNAAKSAKHAHKLGISLKQSVLDLQFMDEATFDAHVDPAKMVEPFG